MATTDRSVSRGREGVTNGHEALNGAAYDDSPRGRDKISTGRGGAGNIVRSPSRDVEPESKGYVPRDKHVSNVLSAGRGGAGNIRSPSREPAAGLDPATEAHEREVLARAAEAREQVHSTGRGGAGNISGSRSRSRSRSQGPGGLLHSTGRGGAGNINHGVGDAEKVDIDDDLERLKHQHAEGIHSTGRGGAANVTLGAAPGIDVPPYHEDAFVSSGRGGAGNIRSRSVSREPGSRAASKDRSGNPITQLWNKVTHPHGPHHTEDPNAIPESAAEETK